MTSDRLFGLTSTKVSRNVVARFPSGTWIPPRSLKRHVPVFVNTKSEQLMGLESVSCKVGMRNTP